MAKYLIQFEYEDIESAAVYDSEEYHKFEEVIIDLKYPMEVYHGNNYMVFENDRDILNAIDLSTISEIEYKSFIKMFNGNSIGVDIIERCLEVSEDIYCNSVGLDIVEDCLEVSEDIY